MLACLFAVIFTVIVLLHLLVTLVQLDLNTSILEKWINDAPNFYCFLYGFRYLPANAW